MAPISALLAVVFLMTSLVRSSELTALFASGYGLFRILGSVLTFLVFLTITLFWFGDQVLPRSMDKRYYIYYVEMKKQPNRYSKTKQKNIWYKTEKAIIHFNEILSPNNVAGVQLFFVDPKWKLINYYEAEDLILDEDIWVLKNGQKTEYVDKTEKFEMTNFDKLALPAVAQLKNMKISGEATENLSIKDLRSLIKQNQRIGLKNYDLKVIFYSKFSFVLATLILPFLGLCATSIDRRGGSMFLSASIGGFMVLAYWILYSSGLSLGKTGMVPPAVAAFTVPTLGFILISVLIRRVLK